jgi:hypothetical protein
MVNKDEIIQTVKDFFDKVDAYFKSLNQIELIAWSLIGLGFLFVILGIIFI